MIFLKKALFLLLQSQFVLRGELLWYFSGNVMRDGRIRSGCFVHQTQFDRRHWGLRTIECCFCKDGRLGLIIVRQGAFWGLWVGSIQSPPSRGYSCQQKLIALKRRETFNYSFLRNIAIKYIFNNIIILKYTYFIIKKKSQSIKALS